MFYAGVHDIDHALGAYLEDQVRMHVEILGAVDKGQMMHGINAIDGALDNIAGAYIADHKLHIADCSA
jgi:hypothetical protein